MQNFARLTFLAMFVYLNNFTEMSTFIDIGYLGYV